MNGIKFPNFEIFLISYSLFFARENVRKEYTKCINIIIVYVILVSRYMRMIIYHAYMVRKRLENREFSFPTLVFKNIIRY